MAGMPGRSGGWNRKVCVDRDSAGRIRYRDRCLCGREKSLAAFYCAACWNKRRDKCKTTWLSCESCGESFFDHGRQRSSALARGAKEHVYCSRKCYEIDSRAKKRLARSRYICEMCGETFWRPTKSQRADRHRFCGKPCSSVAQRLDGLRRDVSLIPLRERVQLVEMWALVKRVRQELGLGRKFR